MGVPNWTGPWSISATYNQYDLVSYLGSSWISSIGSNTGHAPGSDGLWALFASAGQNTPFSSWQGNWDSVVAYQAFDAVYYGGASYASLIGSNAGNTPSPTSSQWALIAGQGGSGEVGTFTFLGVWSVSTQYADNDIVSYLGSSYVATNTPPISTLPTNTTYWTLMSSVGAQGPTGVAGAAGPTGLGLTWRGAWSLFTVYHVNDVVGLIGNSYIAVAANTGVNPSTDGGANWQLAAQGSFPANFSPVSGYFLTGFNQTTGTFSSEAALPLTGGNLTGDLGIAQGTAIYLDGLSDYDWGIGLNPTDNSGWFTTGNISGNILKIVIGGVAQTGGFAIGAAGSDYGAMEIDASSYNVWFGHFVEVLGNLTADGRFYANGPTILAPDISLSGAGVSITGASDGGDIVDFFVSGGVSPVSSINSAGVYTPASFTVSSLPAGAEGQFAYATNGRKASEHGGSPPAPVGTGVPVYFSHGQWRVFSTDAQVQS